MAYQKIDKLDKQILRMIAEDARVPFLEVARACNVSGAAIHQRIQKLTNMGILKGSQFVIDPEKIGYETCAYIGLNLRNPENFDMVVKKLEEIPEVVECQYTTGDFDLFIKIYAVNNHHLLNIIHDKLQPLGLARSETIIAFNSVINRQLPIDNVPVEDEEQFVQAAKKHHILFVKGSAFACPGYVRIAYCTSYERIQASLPAFEKLAVDMGVAR